VSKFAIGRRTRPALMLLLALVIAALAWEGYKLVGGEDGGSVLGVRVLPRFRTPTERELSG